MKVVKTGEILGDITEEITPRMKKSLVVTALSPALLVLAVVAQNSKVVATDRSEWIKLNPVTQLTAASFAKPPAADLPWVRMNLPATADPAEIAAEVREMHDAGIAGVEIGQGAFPNNDQLVALYTAANQLDMKVSLSHGPTQNPPGYSIDSDHARKTLVFGKVTLNAGATFEGPVPQGTLTVVGRGGFGGAGGRGPGAAPVGGRAGAVAAGGRGGPQPTRVTLIAVLAYRCMQAPCPAGGPAELDRASVVDLTSTVTNRNTSGVLGGTTAGSLRWTAPIRRGVSSGRSSHSGHGAHSRNRTYLAKRAIRSCLAAWRRISARESRN